MKRIKLLIGVLVLLGLGGFVMLGSGAAYAEPETIKSGLTVSPPNQKVILVPGESYYGSIKVSSPASSQKDVTYVVEVGSFSERGSEGRKDDYGTVDYIEKSAYNQMMDWIVLEKDGGVLSPNTSDIIPFVINVPEDAPAGGQYASLIVRDESSSDAVGNGVSIKSYMQILSIIYAEVAGETRDEGVILENSIPSFMLNSPLNATSRVRNNGNIHTDVGWTLQVWPLFSDEEICTNEEDPYTTLILPESEMYHIEECDLPIMGIFRAKQTVKIFGETSIVEKTVIVCPLWLLFIIIFAVTMLIIWLVMRSRARRETDEKS